MDLRERPAGATRRHPWEVARERFFTGVLRRSATFDAPCEVLDVGAGDGWFAQRLAAGLPAGSSVTCWDAGYEAPVVAALRAGAPPGVDFVAARPARAFDVVLLLDVLEHVGDDAGFLADVVRHNVAPTGLVLVSVPAWAELYTRHDARLRHYRRYSARAATRVVEGAGLRIDARGGLFYSLLPARAAQKALERARDHRAGGAGDDGPPPPLVWRRAAWLATAAEGLLTADGLLSRAAARAGVGVPGLSWWAVCRRA
jgi:SAM-dependent methyltransferase